MYVEEDRIELRVFYNLLIAFPLLFLHRSVLQLIRGRLPTDYCTFFFQCLWNMRASIFPPVFFLWRNCVYEPRWKIGSQCVRSPAFSFDTCIHSCQSSSLGIKGPGYTNDRSFDVWAFSHEGEEPIWRQDHEDPSCPDCAPIRWQGQVGVERGQGAWATA